AGLPGCGSNSSGFSRLPLVLVAVISGAAWISAVPRNRQLASGERLSPPWSVGGCVLPPSMKPIMHSSLPDELEAGSNRFPENINVQPLASDGNSRYRLRPGTL